MLNNNDIKLVEKAVTKGYRDQDSSNAWERVKKALSGSGQNSAEKTQPEGETNKLKAEIAKIADSIKESNFYKHYGTIREYVDQLHSAIQ